MQKQSTINHKLTVEYLTLIFEKSNDSKLNYADDKQMEDAIRFISELFHTTPTQSGLLSVIFCFQMDNHEVSFERLLNYLGLQLQDYFDLQTEVQELINQRILKSKRDNLNTKNLYHSSYTVNPKVIDALFGNKSIEEGLKEPEQDFVQFCGHISRVIRSFSTRRFTIYDLVEQVSSIENRNPNLVAIQSLKELQLPIEERILLYSLTESLTSDNESMVNLSNLIKQIFGTENYHSILSSFMQIEQELQLKELVQVESKGFVEDALIGLTPKSKTLLLGDSFTFYSKQGNTKHTLIRCETITPKQLFFNDKLKSEIDFFKSSIKPENLNKLKEKLTTSNIKKSIITLFDGCPGTGKTESTYQIARELGYDLFLLDFTQMKSAYYSESQRLVKEAFNEYREICKSNQRPVILLINEADGLLHQRINNTENHSSDHTENEIQSILLEEFEKSNDIIILTTNLMDNIDSAFYRRFLFKIRFDQPSKEVIKQIFESKLFWLSENDLAQISTIELTGGEIDNIVTKILLHEVIHSEHPTVEQIIEFCKQEKTGKQKTAKVGF